MSCANYPLFCIVEEDMVSLGIQSGSYSLSGSSTKRIKISWNNYYSYYAGNARLHGSSAWMPGYTRPGQYLEINFGSSKYITGIATQGTGRWNENNFVRSYSLQYYDGKNWIGYKEFGEKKIFPGNTDVSSVVKNFLSVPTAMQKLRIYPESWNNEIALRIELYSN
ncbi:Hypothetical predicted protein, partial [Paramuricea clavata]